MLVHPRPAGVYVHFPFCIRKCPYCDFTSKAIPWSDVPHDRYAEAVAKEAFCRAERLAEPLDFSSVYFGGGTPSLWTATSVRYVLRSLEASMGLSLPRAEVSFECNPCSLDVAKVGALRDAGVNRFSVGMQSADPRRLVWLGRMHDVKTGVEALQAAVRSGARVSADLIHGLPTQTPIEAAAEARRFVEQGVGHVSAYLLTVEAGTPLCDAMSRGHTELIDEDQAADSFLAVSDELVRLGFDHYEVSNFARAGQECVHNTNVWAGHPYLGLGAGAVGCVTSGDGRVVRYRNDGDPDGYMRAMNDWRPEHAAQPVGRGEQEELSADVRLTEAIMLGLRTSCGIDLDEAGARLGVPAWTPHRERAATWLVARGRLVKQGTRASIPPHAFVWANDTIARLL